MRRGLKIGGVIAATAVLAGCIITRSYVEPTTGALAYFNATDVSGHPIYPATFAKAENCIGRYLVKSPDKSGFKPGSEMPFVRVEAGKPVSFAFVLESSYNTFCRPAVNFTPEAGRYYHLSMSDHDGACYGAMVSADNAALAHPRREKFLKMEYEPNLALDENGSFCDSSKASEVGPQ